MYADDTSLMYKARNECELQNNLNSCLNKVAKWFDANKLTLNVDKTKFMNFGTKRILDKFTNVRLTFNNNIIERVDEFKYLGVKLDSNLSWITHIDYLCKNVSKRIGIIKRVKHFLPHQTTVMLSNALVIPHFDYGCTVWSNFSSELQNKVQVLHNNLARIILSADIRTPVNDMMDALQWVKLEKRWHEQLLLIVFKCLKNMGPSYLSSKFEFVHDYHSYKTRNHTTNTLVVPKFNSNAGLRTFHVRAAHAWNNVSPIVRTELDSKPTSQFKSKIQQT